MQKNSIEYTIVNRLKEIKVSCDEIDVKLLFEKYFERLVFENITVYHSLVLWTADDWVMFLPYICDLKYRKFLKDYICILRFILDNNVLVFNHELDYNYICLRLWVEGVDTIKDKIDNYRGMKVFSIPFHEEVILSDGLNLKYNCLHCQLNCQCLMHNMNMGNCSENTSRKLKNCCPHACIHLCSKHSPLLFDFDKNRFGLNEIYKLKDGRNVMSLAVLKNLNQVDFKQYFYNSNCDSLFQKKE